MNTKITIKSINAKPAIDPYHRDTGQLTTTYLNIFPDERDVTVTQEYDDNSTLENFWNGRDIQIKISGYPTAEELRELIEGEDVQALLVRICNGHTVEWDGNNHVGHCDDDSAAALDELTELLSDAEIGTQRVAWTLDEWLPKRSLDDLITANTTDAELDAMIKPEWSGDADNIVIGNVLDYIREIRDAKRAEE